MLQPIYLHLTSNLSKFWKDGGYDCGGNDITNVVASLWLHLGSIYYIEQSNQMKTSWNFFSSDTDLILLTTISHPGRWGYCGNGTIIPPQKKIYIKHKEVFFKRRFSVWGISVTQASTLEPHPCSNHIIISKTHFFRGQNSPVRNKGARITHPYIPMPVMQKMTPSLLSRNNS